MSTDLEEQEDELLALHSIFSSEEFVRNESKPAGEIRVSVELPADFTVALTEEDAVRQYDISALPPLLLTFELPEDYPNSSPPSFTLTCSWLTHTQLSALGAQLTELYQATGGAVVLFSWVQFLKEDALRFLGIHSLLELHSDEHDTQHGSRNTAQSETDNNQDTPKPGSTDDQSCDVSDLPASSLEDQQIQSISDQSSRDSQGVRRVSQSSTAQASGVKEDKAEDQGGCSNEDDVSASSLLPSSSSGEDQSGQEGAAPASCQNKARPPSRPSPTPSQALLSQLLIYDAAQRQRAFASTVFDCGVCFVGSLGSDCVQLPECGHIFCRTCLTELCKLQITEGNVRAVTCPQADCTASPTPAQVKSLVGEELFSRYDRLLLQSTLDLMPDVAYCPRRSCGAAVILEKSSTAAMCFVCSFAFCVTCRKTYHGAGDCQEKKAVKELIEDLQQRHAELPESREGMKALWEDYTSGSQERQLILRSRYGHSALHCNLEDSLSEHWMEFNCKNCPHCFCRIQKNDGCNRMTCSQCRRQFCWACLEREPTGYHYVDNRSCRLLEWH